MIKSAEFIDTGVVTIDRGSSVNVEIAVEPSDLTEHEASHILKIIGALSSDGSPEWVLCNYVGYNNGIVTISITNNGIPQNTTMTITARIRYSYTPNIFIDTSNTKQIKGGATE